MEDYQPKQKVVDGENILSLLFPMGSLGANSAKTLEVYMMVEGGTLTIAPTNCKAAVAGSGIASGYTEWDGKIVIEEKLSLLSLPDAIVTMKGLSDETELSFRTDVGDAISDSVGIYRLASTVTLFGLSDGGAVTEEVVET